MEIAALILLIITGMVMVAYGYIEDEYNFLLGGLSISILFSLMLGLTLGVNSNYKVKQPVTPKIKIECIDNKCDTIYIYKFKNI
jgi:hypothetical protein